MKHQHNAGYRIREKTDSESRVKQGYTNPGHGNISEV